VAGTSGDDVIGAGYVDDDNDRVDSDDGDNDVIVGEGGGDPTIAQRWKWIRRPSQTVKGANTDPRNILNFKKKQNNSPKTATLGTLFLHHGVRKGAIN